MHKYNLKNKSNIFINKTTTPRGGVIVEAAEEATEAPEDSRPRIFDPRRGRRDHKEPQRASVGCQTKVSSNPVGKKKSRCERAREAHAREKAYTPTQPVAEETTKRI